MGAVASQITSLTIAYSTADSDADQRKHQSSASLAFNGASNAENISIWWRHHMWENSDDNSYAVGANNVPSDTTMPIYSQMHLQNA